MTPPRNTGKAFEQVLTEICGHYASRGLLRVKKVDPPTKTFGRGQIIHLPNPFLDFVGCWTARAGRAVFFEAKSVTNKPHLAFGSGGLSDTQIESLRQWHAAGAVAFVLWERSGEVRLVTWPQIGDALKLGRRHLVWEDCYAVPQGKGYLIHDFLQVMEQLWA